MEMISASTMQALTGTGRPRYPPTPEGSGLTSAVGKGTLGGERLALGRTWEMAMHMGEAGGYRRRGRGVHGDYDVNAWKDKVDTYIY